MTFGSKPIGLLIVGLASLPQPAKHACEQPTHLLMISVSKPSVTEAYSGCARRAAVAAASSAGVAPGPGSGGGITGPARRPLCCAAVKLPQRLGAGPARGRAREGARAMPCYHWHDASDA